MEGDSKAEAIWATCQVFAFDARKVFRARITNGHEVTKWPVRDGLNGALRNRARRPVRPDVYKEGMVGTSVVLGMCVPSQVPLQAFLSCFLHLRNFSGQIAAREPDRLAHA